MIEQKFTKYELDEFYSQAQKNIKQKLSTEDYLKSELNIDINGNIEYRNSSISLVISHFLVDTPSIKIKIKFINSIHKNIGHYALYLDLDKKFLDEYFVIY
jgi:hypothetical protein